MLPLTPLVADSLRVLGGRLAVGNAAATATTQNGNPSAKKRKLQILTSASRVQSLEQTPLLLHCDCGVRPVLGEDGGDGRGLLGADLAEGGSVGSSDWRNFSRYQVRRGLPRRHRRRRGRDSGKSVRARERVSCTLLLQSVGRSKSGRAIKATRKFATAPSQHRWCPKLAAMHSLEQKHTHTR